MTTKLINTFRLQMIELNLFMMERGFVPNGTGFQCMERPEYVSFNKAVDMFNTTESIQGQTLANVKLKYAKRQKRVICQSFQVKLADQVRAAFPELTGEQIIALAVKAS